MSDKFVIKVTANKLEAYLDLAKDVYDILDITKEDVMRFLQENNIVGINENVIDDLLLTRDVKKLPLLVATGQQPVNGEDGYLQSEIEKNDNSSNEVNKKEPLNLRHVLKIPSVSKGQLIARVVPPTEGKHGIDVFGKEISAKYGKAFRVRQGKNIEIKDDSIYALIDGQVNIVNKQINVLPIFCVNGDLDLKVGNIDFIGNVEIRGSVPTGYTIKAGGDVKINGLVEGAIIEAEGSIYILGGVAGMSRGLIKAGGNLRTSYLNQANVNVAGDIEVTSSIMHSICSSGGHIVCQQGSIIGGQVSACKGIEVKDVGNHMHTRTEICIGVSQEILAKEFQSRRQLTELLQSKEKLTVILQKLTEKYRETGNLSMREIEVLQKQKVTEATLAEQIKQVQMELDDLQDYFGDITENKITIKNTLYPNTHLHFGKYKLVTNRSYHHVHVFVDNSEIVVNPIL
ncbi:DUF342 domain-containing protein [Bacillus sp. HMF5848]|uniref:DUF342 domain-containing protein n=1 Tax=Bacillus sp. HMF5848 TaxID=2495421 RepID=UPI000F78962C|nr:FapA family protein [Bacillus sp. HMF5848]RSK27053.1 DUF342 domain-containing protein [Bacillus sp. HMF5848]